MMDISYKVLARWLEPLFGEEGYKSKRYFSPADFKCIADRIGLPGIYFTDKNDILHTRQGIR